MPMAGNKRLREGAGCDEKAPVIRIQVEGSEYLEKHGISDVLSNLLGEAAAEQPEDPLRFLGEALLAQSRANAKKAYSVKPSIACTPGGFEYDLHRRFEMSARAKRMGEDTRAGEVSIACNGGRDFPIFRQETALVMIDMQSDFLEPNGRVGQHYRDSPVRSGLEGCQRLLAAARAAGLTIAHTRSFRYGATVRDDLVGVGDEGFDIHPTLRPLEGEILVDKWTYGAFASTPLERELRARGVERILLCGVLTNVCLLNSAQQAVDRFFRVCVVEDCCAAFVPNWHSMALQILNEPQISRGHNAQVGLYFGEVASVDSVEAALAPLAKSCNGP